MTEDDIDSLIEETKQKSEEFSQAQKEVQKLKEKLRSTVAQMYDQEEISEGEYEDLKDLIDKGEYGKVRSEINNCLNKLEFEDEDKQQFADKFGEGFQELEAVVEQIRNTLTALNATGDQDRETVIATIYGKHSSINKSTLRDVFDVVDSIESTGMSDKQTARAMSGLKSDLTVSDAEKVISAIKEETQ